MASKRQCSSRSRTIFERIDGERGPVMILTTKINVGYHNSSLNIT